MIVLVMIVRNEEKTIAETLRSALPAVDRVCIVDTGSADRTWELAADTLIGWWKSDRGLIDPPRWHMFRCPWVDYSHNRNEALELAIKEFGPDNWFWMLDSDTRISGASLLRRFLLDRDWDTYPGPVHESLPDSANVQARYKDGTITWPMHTIIRGTSPCRYTGVVHEVMRKPEGSILPEPTIIPGVEIVYQGTDFRDKAKTWREHIRLLTNEIARKGGSVANAPRETYYLAQSHACLQEWGIANIYYMRRYNSWTGYDAERWYAGLQAVWCAQMGDLPDGDYIGLLADLCQQRPWRAEAWYRRALVEGDWGRWDACLNFAQIAASLDFPIPEVDAYMIQRDVYLWEADVLVAIAATELDPKRGLKEIHRIIRDKFSLLPRAEVLRLTQLEARCMAALAEVE